mmetsp:Transcript_102176/g.286389  ORF Transcript_102176/g.286389 Transcript_102176/m.286389 type:complete len:229 (-) Transcript_102176:839-1525(-)
MLHTSRARGPQRAPTPLARSKLQAARVEAAAAPGNDGDLLEAGPLAAALRRHLFRKDPQIGLQMRHEAVPVGEHVHLRDCDGVCCALDHGPERHEVPGDADEVHAPHTLSPELAAAGDDLQHHPDDRRVQDLGPERTEVEDLDTFQQQLAPILGQLHLETLVALHDVQVVPEKLLQTAVQVPEEVLQHRHPQRRHQVPHDWIAMRARQATSGLWVHLPALADVVRCQV